MKQFISIRQLQRFVHFRRDVIQRSLLCFLMFFLIIFSYYMAKPIRNSLFLEWMGPAKLPLVYILSSFVSLITAMVLQWQLKNKLPRYLMGGALAFFSFMLLLFRLCFSLCFFQHQSAFFALSLYVYISFFSVAAVTLFWSVCNDSFSPEEGRSYYGYIGMGGILGGLLGSISTTHLTPLIGTENLLSVSAVILLFSVPLPYFIIRSKYPEPNPVLPQPNSVLFSEVIRVFRTPTIAYIAVIVLFCTIVATLFDFHFQSVIKSSGLTKNERTILFSQIFTYINLFGLLVHLVLTRWFLKRFGTLPALLVLPILSLVSLGLLMRYTSLDIVIVIWTLFSGTNYSLFQVAKENLYIPLDRSIKYIGKLYNGTFVFRFGDTLASLLLLAFPFISSKLHISLFSLMGALTCLWLLILVAFYKKSHRIVS